MVVWVVMGVSVGASGCTAVSGLRSVGLDRPTFLGFWDRSQPPSPGLGDDYYAQSMHAGDGRSSAVARRAEDARIRSEADGDARRASVVATSDRAGTTRRSRATARPERDEPVPVSLGRPEPLPAFADSTAATTEPASSPARSPWKPDQPAARAASSRVPQPARQPGQPHTAEQTRTALAQGQPARRAAQDARTILAQCQARVESLDTYQVRMSRVERVGGRLQPEEEVILSIRRDPKAVRLEWTSGSNRGREVIYSTQLDQGSLFVHMPSSAIPLPTMKIPVDSPMVMKNSRHAITEAGLDTVVAHLRKCLDQEHPSSAEPAEPIYRGVETPPGLDRPSHRFTRRSPSGETWTVYLDVQTLLPCMVLAHDAMGGLDERYVYQEVRRDLAELASPDAFDPNRRWGEPKSWLSRFARAAAGGQDPDPPPAATR
jgi:hypothetical protein